jgi:hypothetical protein
MTPPRPVIWSRCERCGNPVAIFDHDELAYLMAVHNGAVHDACPTEAQLERILNHANPISRAVSGQLAGHAQRLVFHTERRGSGG